MSETPKGPEVFEQHYLRGENPRAQSGFGGDERRWEVARRPIVSAIDRDGCFLDIGCANGHLMESVARWSSHGVEPYGLDFAGKLVALARRRLPQWADRVFHGGARLGPAAPLRFRLRGALLRDSGARARLVQRLLGRVVAPGGRLILCSYGSPRSGLATQRVGQQLRSWDYEPELELRQEAPEGGGAIIEPFERTDGRWGGLERSTREGHTAG